MSSSSSPYLFLGVDGGGTKTAISLVSSAGVELDSLIAPSSNPNSVGEDGASECVKQAIKQIIQKNGASLSSVRSVVLSLSGCNSAGDSRRMERWLADLFPHAINAEEANKRTDNNDQLMLVSAYNDSIAALVSGTDGVLDGVVVISGTGMICKGFSSGVEATAAGNGALIDLGSGYSLGLGVLKAAFASEDGMGPRSALNSAALNQLKLDRTEQLVDWLYADHSWDRVARLAPLALSYAGVSSGDVFAPSGAPPFPASPAEVDSAAKRIVEEGAEFLVRSIKAVANKLKFEQDAKFTVVCAGGILKNPLMFSLLLSGVTSAYPHARLVHPSVSAATGAALLARTQWNSTQTK